MLCMVRHKHMMNSSMCSLCDHDWGDALNPVNIGTPWGTKCTWIPWHQYARTCVPGGYQKTKNLSGTHDSDNYICPHVSSYAVESCSSLTVFFHITCNWIVQSSEIKKINYNLKIGQKNVAWKCFRFQNKLLHNPFITFPAENCCICR